MKGGALATLFAADVAEYGMDAGRGLPQLEPSAPWWTRMSESLFNNKNSNGSFDMSRAGPPRPKDIRLYSFGSPRVGNEEFVEKFDSLVSEGALKEAYRVVNGEDVVARLPRTFNAGVVKIGYEHSGATALVSDIVQDTRPLLWVEGESDSSQCPVRDGNTFTSPLADGNLLGDLVGAVKDGLASSDEQEVKASDKLGQLASSITGRLKNLDTSDLVGVLGIDKGYVDRESKIFQSLFSGDAIGHHMEDQYYLAMGRASGFAAVVGEEIQDL